MWDALSRFRSLTMPSSTCPRGALLDSSSSNVQVRNTSASEVARHRASSKQQATKQASKRVRVRVETVSARATCFLMRPIPILHGVGMVCYLLCMYLHVDTNINRGTCMLSPPTARLSIMMAVPALPRSRSIFHGTTCSNLHLVSLQQIPQSS